MAKRTTLYPDPFPYADYRRYTYAMGIDAGDLIFVAGHLADEYDPQVGRMVVRGDLADQTRLALEKVRLVLDSAGCGPGDVVHQVDYIVPSAVDSYLSTLDVRREFYGESLPVTTTVVANQLLRPQSLIEVEVVAARGPSPGEPVSPSAAYPGLLPAPDVVRKGDFLFITAHPPVGPGGNQAAAPDDVAEQIEAIYETIGRTLEDAGASPTDVLRTIDYLTPAGLANYKATADVRKAFFKGDFPAATGIIVEGLPMPGALLDVSVIASLASGPRQTYNPGWSRFDRLTFSPSARKGDLLCLAGFMGADPSTREVPSGGLVPQTRQVYQLAAVVLAEAGLSMKNVVKTVDYITPEALADYRGTVDVRREFFGDDFPVSTGIIVNRLLRPECLIEIDFTAVVN